MKCSLAAVVMLAMFKSASASEAVAKQADESTVSPALEVVAKLVQGPGNITVTASGQVIVSLHQFFAQDIRVASVGDEGTLTEFAAAANLDSVLGLQADARGIVWLLDNAMRNKTTRRLVGWHERSNEVVSDIDLTHATTEQSFLNDLAVDPDRQTAYVADPAGGTDAAIIVVDLARGASRRLLQGHASVTPEDMDLIIDDTPVRIRKDDGSEIRPRIGVNPIAIDSRGEWLYYGPMHGHKMYRIPTADLRNTELTPAELAAKVEYWATKPICDGISIDDAGNLYLGDLANNAIGVIGPDRRYRQLVAEPRLSWVDAFSFGPDGLLYVVTNQLHRTAVLNAGKAATRPPYLILRLTPLAPGTGGR